MLRTSVLCFLIVSSLGTTGCGTIYSQRNYWLNPSGDEGITVLDGLWVYGGTLNDVNLVFEIFGLTLIDLPLSLAADTIILPMTISQQIIGRPKDQKKDATGGKENSPPARSE